MAVVVDGYSTASFLAPAFLAHGMRCVHVSSGEQRVPALRATHSPELYLADLAADAGLLDRLAAFRVAHVLPGLDSGSELASDLAAQLDVPTRNDEHLARARRDKAAMLGALRDAGVPVRAHAEVGSADEAVAWCTARGRGALPAAGGRWW
ncbi:hypothetical protein UK23_32335 [Lentzea aerocolonigenes]|uniref:Uncharacterized protein n=1 Tax=Lentzea aerocolonigenes TaxID=68170 RepID=A0A0F0GQG4_LENAE|nr:hypothetical protein [Lentzea aerocolonigenes]KJK43663.1 hypothetical protein UK23_32335 [Lentzea aerocolonigenes]